MDTEVNRSYSKLCAPGIAIDDSIVKFIENFFLLSDTPDAHEEYSRQYTEDATFILASKLSKGRSEVLETRKGMWSAVKARQHNILKIFPFGNNSNEVMIYGEVKYELKAGGFSEKDWAARAVLAPAGEGKWQLKFYQVYLDTAPGSSPKSN